jgi:molybdopterin converting factor subunit 1
MKHVTVRFFAAFRDATGVERAALESDAATVDALFEEMTGRYEGLERETAALVAINDAMVPWTAPFADGDEVLFFPPVAGG